MWMVPGARQRDEAELKLTSCGHPSPLAQDRSDESIDHKLDPITGADVVKAA